MTSGSPEEKSQLMFSMNDIGGTGFLSKEEFARMLRFQELLLFFMAAQCFLRCFAGSSLPFWCIAGLSLKSLMAFCQRHRQRTASRPWCRLQALITRRKSHGGIFIPSWRTTKRSCSLLNSMSKVWTSLALDLHLSSPSFLDLIWAKAVSVLWTGMEKQGRKRLSRDQRVSFILPANR